ncbi:MAG: ribose-phosphate diphosphokinase [Hyphomonadaceae bacterium]
MTVGGIYFSMPGNEAMASALAKRSHGNLGVLEHRRFPDAESYVRLASDVRGMDVTIVCTLARPDPQFLPLVFAADAARDCGAASVALVAPYLAYMRQDARFSEGEAMSSASFARRLSRSFDRIVTIDPHLHRHRSLDDLFDIPVHVAHAAPLLANWIAQNVNDPLIIGPDRESEQWIAAVANQVGAPHVVANKNRRGDRLVETSLPDLVQFAERSPVLVDDIVSSGRTMIEAARLLAAQGFAKPYCVIVHPIFSGNAFAEMLDAAQCIVSCDTISHVSNGIEVVSLLG